jgi:ethanolaminephosphotransferase
MFTMALFNSRSILLSFANIGVVLAVGIFMAGYFCPPPTLAFDHDLEQAELEQSGVENVDSRPSPSFEKVVFMVIDALRRCDTILSLDARSEYVGKAG